MTSGRAAIRWLVASCCCVGVLTVPHSAAADTNVTVIGGVLRIDSLSSTDVNVMTIAPAPSPGAIRVTDSVTILSGLNCSIVNSTTTDCTGVGSINIGTSTGLGSQSDSLTTNALITQPMSVLGGLGADTMTTGAGNDTFNEGSSTSGGDTFNGGAGTDAVTYASRSNAITATVNDTVGDGEAAENDDIRTDVENVTGGSAGDSLTGDGDANSLDGQAGDDTLTGGLGADGLIGGLDTDTASFADHAGAITADIDNVGDDGSNCPGVSCEADNVTLSIENLTGGGGSDNLTGTGSANVLTGGSGADTFTPLDAGDTVNGDDGNDTIIENSNGGGGDGGDDYNGGADNDTADYSATSSMTVDLDNVADDGSGPENDNVRTDIENVIGSPFQDTIAGSSAQNTLTGGDGNDTLIGGEGADNLVAGNGTDTASYEDRGAGDAVTAAIGTVSGNGVAGADGIGDNLSNSFENLRGGLGADDLSGDGNVNQILGGGGADRLVGAGGNDILNGEQGIDTFDEGPLTNGDGADTLNGGSEADTVSYDGRSAATPITASMGGGLDGAAGEGDGIATDVESIEGGEGNDVLTGDSVDNDLTGNGGNDTLTGGAGADGMDGGTGIDTASYEDHTVVSATIGTTSGNGNASDGAGDDLSAGIDNLIGGPGSDTLQGNGAANTLTGGGNGDTLTGGGQADVLNGDAGADVFFEDGAPNGADTFNGGSEQDRVDYAGRTNPLSVDIDGVADDGQGGAAEGDNVQTDVENLTGGTVGDSLTGDGANNVLDGQGGDDTLTGGLGADILTGAGGADSVDEGAAPNGPDSFSGGADTDSISYASRGAAVTIRQDGLANDGEAGENDLIFTDVENLTGGGGNDLLAGTPANTNVYTGGAGTDTVDYSAATATIIADIDGAAGDDGQGGADDDTIQTDIENLNGSPGQQNNLTGSSGPNVLTGGTSNDTLTGLAGDDTLAGGSGPIIDTYSGGDDTDTVSYATHGNPVTADLDGAANDDGQLGEAESIPADVESLTGSPLDDTLTGNAGPNTLTGGLGADTLNLLAGADVAIAQDGIVDTIDCTGGGTDSGTFDLAPLEDFVSCANGDGDLVPDLADACPSQAGSQADGCLPPVVNPPVVNPPPGPSAPKKCKKGQKLKKGKCVKKKRKKKK